MKNTEFMSMGAKFQFGHAFGPQFGGWAESAAEDEAPETDLSGSDLLEVSVPHADEPESSEDEVQDSEASEEDAPELSAVEAETEDGETVELDEAETDLTATGDDDDSSLFATDAEVSQTVTATYSEEAIAELKFMIEEEKLAGDIYDVFYNMYGLKIFDNIARSEDSHFNALIDQAESLGLDVDQFLFEPVGTFEDPELQEMYDTLLAQGAESVTDALEVGKAIEEKDMVDIAAAIEDVEGTTLAKVYDNLLTGSSYHLEAFDSLLLA